ncbi:NAD(P)/FAD-dependent oxidoreductase [Rhodococcus pyridinivorans]|uniref:flavin-containing monooxygenase n=1 Tax=Rhodococcus pyridinivorans TaxID=103816 RepID=UPI00200B2134|nr:NAD(P)/FAD-dependent oxidoreductase [Rhodococcus pyridinivorans]UPW02451.1 NAD(P)/FAD-dependent oxidoreductase [Rhodococcus pyridinivorans]
MIDTEVLIVGGGLAGLGAAHYLTRRGRTVHVLERSSGPGGTWLENTYPGCECDIHPALYSYSFTRLPGWISGRADHHQILRHSRLLADRIHRVARVDYDTEVTDCHWNDTDARWHVHTRSGTLHRARFLVLATGALNVPRIPRLPGSFAGPVLHTARWNHDLDLRGARVGVIGTGASAAQLVPALIDHAGQVTVFQRTPAWVLPRTRTRVPLPYRARRTVEYWRNETLLPALTGSKRRRAALEARALRHLHAQIPDPVLRRALTPSYRIGCKRIIFSDTLYPALCHPTTTLVTSPLTELAADAVRTADGRRHEIDVLVHATGFHVSAALMRLPIHGRNGVSLQEVWARDGVSAHLGTTVAGIPNAFILGGPNTGVGHTSVLFMLESQLRYVAAALDETDRTGADALVVREQAQHRSTTRIHHDSAATTWTRGGCRSWYLDREGINRSLWPGATWRYRLHTRTFDLHNYTLIRASTGGSDGIEQAEPGRQRDEIGSATGN